MTTEHLHGDMPIPIPANESDRLAALRRLQILDTLPQKAFDSITALAAGICGTPMALISLVDSNRQWFKSRQGVELTQTSRSEAFCAHAIMEPSEVLVVNDATHDERFQDFPMVRRGELVFYDDQLNFAWRGLYKNEPAEMGVYSYVLKGFGESSRGREPVYYRGNLTLVR